MPLNIPTAQMPNWGLERLMMEAPYYKARGEYYKEGALKAAEAIKEKQDIQAATEAATKPGEPMAMQSPGGQFLLSLGHAPSTVNQLDVISELEKRNPTAAETLKDHYMNELEKTQKFNDAQVDRVHNRFLTGMLMLKSGAIDQAMPMLKDAMPNLASIQKVDSENMAFTGMDGSKEIVNIPGYIMSLNNAKDLMTDMSKFRLELVKQAKELKASELKDGVFPTKSGLKVTFQNIMSDYHAEYDPVIKYWSDPKNVAIGELRPEFNDYMKKKLIEAKDMTPEKFARQRYGIDITGQAPAMAIPAEKVKGARGRPGAMVAKTPGGTAPIPKAPQEALDYLKEHPESKDDFESYYGYFPK